MSIIKLNTGFNIEVAFNIAPFHKRLFAWLIDLAVQVAYLYLASKLLSFLLGDARIDNWEWLQVLYYLPVFFYHLFMELRLNGQSVGKLALGLQVITTEGGQPTLSQYLLRWMFKPVDFPYWILFAVGQGSWPWYTVGFVFAGLICMVVTPGSQRIGDLVAGTILIDTRQKAQWQDTVFTEVEAGYSPQFPQVMKLSDRDMNTVKQVLQTNGSNNDYKQRVAEKIKSALRIETDLEADELLEVLLKDYNYLSAK